jgi:hypothetical protein
VTKILSFATKIIVFYFQISSSGKHNFHNTYELFSPILSSLTHVPQTFHISHYLLSFYLFLACHNHSLLGSNQRWWNHFIHPMFTKSSYPLSLDPSLGNLQGSLFWVALCVQPFSKIKSNFFSNPLVEVNKPFNISTSFLVFLNQPSSCCWFSILPLLRRWWGGDFNHNVILNQELLNCLACVLLLPWWFWNVGLKLFAKCFT